MRSTMRIPGLLLCLISGVAWAGEGNVAPAAEKKADEKKAKDFDLKLAKILRDMSPRLIEFIAFLIDSEIPSLTVLAMITIASDEAGKICFEAFGTPVKGVDFSIVKFEDPKISERVTLWWDFIFVANQISKTLKLADLRENEKFIERVSGELSQMLRDFLVKNEVQNFNQATLKKLLHKYEEKMFAKPASKKP